jgi:hypothetical protein
MAVALGLTLTGAGRLSLDRILGIKVPAYLAVLVAAGVMLGTGVTLARRAAMLRQIDKEAQTATEAAVVEPQLKKGRTDKPETRITPEMEEDIGRSAA